MQPFLHNLTSVHILHLWMSMKNPHIEEIKKQQNGTKRICSPQTSVCLSFFFFLFLFPKAFVS